MAAPAAGDLPKIPAPSAPAPAPMAPPLSARCSSALIPAQPIKDATNRMTISIFIVLIVPPLAFHFGFDCGQGNSIGLLPHLASEKKRESPCFVESVILDSGKSNSRYRNENHYLPVAGLVKWGKACNIGRRGG
jgi:hypothetical protein